MAVILDGVAPCRKRMLSESFGIADCIGNKVVGYLIF